MRTLLRFRNQSITKTPHLVYQRLSVFSCQGLELEGPPIQEALCICISESPFKSKFRGHPHRHSLISFLKRDEQLKIEAILRQ